jgi:predicted alpha/beta superfamily hydrolase
MKELCMHCKSVLLTVLFGLIIASSYTLASEIPQPAVPLVIGETFLIQSSVLNETRRINVYFPPGYSASSENALPVLYMPDGGLAEDFLHVAGLIQVSVGNKTMRPFLLVGIENTERRRDRTGPTEIEEDKKIAPHVGGSKNFRKFIRYELVPEIRKRYRTTPEAGIVGESLAGLFIVETFLLDPDLFDTYIAIDPSLWWNNQYLLRNEAALLKRHHRLGKSLFVASSSYPELAAGARQFETTLLNSKIADLRFTSKSFTEETHATIYHPAALYAFRSVLAPSVPIQGDEPQAVPH